MTNLAAQQLSSGDSGRTWEALERVRQYAEKIQTGLVYDHKKLRDAELLMQRTSFHLRRILSEALYEDGPVLEATLTS